MDFAVVKFENNTYSEVPVGWLSNVDKTECWWPKCQNPCSLMLRNVVPGSAMVEWKKYRISVECYACKVVINQ